MRGPCVAVNGPAPSGNRATNRTPKVTTRATFRHHGNMFRYSLREILCRMQPGFPLRVAVSPRNSQLIQLRSPDQETHLLRRRGRQERFSTANRQCKFCHAPSSPVHLRWRHTATCHSASSSKCPPSGHGHQSPCHCCPSFCLATHRQRLAGFPNVVTLEVANVADVPITSLDHSQQRGFAVHSPKAATRSGLVRQSRPRHLFTL